MTMPEPVDEPTTLRIDCADCPLVPGLRFDLLDIRATVTLRKAESETSVWREQPPDDATEMTVSSGDDRLQIQRPRVVTLRVPAGEPEQPGTYELVAELTHGDEIIRWPAEPRRVTFEV